METQPPAAALQFVRAKRRAGVDASKRARRRFDPEDAAAAGAFGGAGGGGAGEAGEGNENVKRSVNAMMEATPGAQLPLNKRTRMENGAVAAGAGAAAANPEMDAPRYSLRQAQQWEQQKGEELGALRSEYHAYAQRREADIQSMTAEHMQLQERAAAMEGELQRLARVEEENAVLKRGVSILQARGAAQASAPQVDALQQSLQQALEHIKRLEQTNYALQVHLHTRGGGMMDGEQPPDVY